MSIPNNKFQQTLDQIKRFIAIIYFSSGTLTVWGQRDPIIEFQYMLANLHPSHGWICKAQLFPVTIRYEPTLI